MRPPPDSHVPARRAGSRHSRQDRAEDDARDGHKLRHPPRDRLPQVQLVQGEGRQDVRERHRARLRGRRALGEDGHRRHRVQAALGQGVLRPRLRLREQGDRRLVRIYAPEHGPATRVARPAPGEDARRVGPHSALRHGMAVPAGRVVQPTSRGRRGPEHVEEGQLHRQRGDRAGVRPHERRVLQRPVVG